MSGISELTKDVAHRLACESLTTDAILTLIGSAQPKDADIDGISVGPDGVAYVVHLGGGFRQT